MPLKEGPVLRCSADAVLEAAPQGGPAKRNTSCLIKPHEALKKSWALIVDLRQGTAFGRGRIPDAVNMTLTELLANPVLSSKKVLVYDQGTVQADAEVLCARLRDRGFKNAQVLSGGYVGWARKQPGMDLLPQAEVSAADLMGEIASGTPLVVLLGDGYPEGQLGSRVIRVADTSASAVTIAINENLRKHGGQKVSRVVLIGGHTIPDAQWQAWLVVPDVAQPILYYRATPDELNQSIRKLNALWAKQAQGATAPKGCSAS